MVDVCLHISYACLRYVLSLRVTVWLYLKDFKNQHDQTTQRNAVWKYRPPAPTLWQTGEQLISHVSGGACLCVCAHTCAWKRWPTGLASGHFIKVCFNLLLCSCEPLHPETHTGIHIHTYSESQTHSFGTGWRGIPVKGMRTDGGTAGDSRRGGQEQQPYRISWAPLLGPGVSQPN